MSATTEKPDVRPAQADVLIVGNGALGLFLARELSAAGAGSIVVVGPADRSSGGSQAAGAMMGCFAEATSESLRTQPARTRFELGVAAHERWPAVLAALQEHAPGGRPLLTAPETHVVLNSIGAELDNVNLAAIINALTEYGKPWQECDPHDIPGFNPRTDTRALRAILLPEEGAVDARAVLTALQSDLQASGVTLLDASVRTLLGDSDSVTGAELDDGHVIEAGKVVVAAGALSDSVLKTLIPDLDLVPTFAGLGFAMIARRTGGEPFRSVVRTPNRGFACGLHVVPQGDGTEYYGATNRLVDEVGSTTWMADVRFLAQYSMQQLDERAASHEVVRWLAGNRPVTLDGFPLIGWLPRAGLYLMSGTYRDGFHCAPLLAAHVANELQGKPGLIDPIFQPTRRPVATRTVEGSIQEYVEHNLAGWFETGAQAAPQMTTKQIADYYRNMATQFYERVGTDYALGPDILWYAQGSLLGGRRVARYLRRLQPAAAGAGAL
ncbi:NAD(P)/FAD-dependent oxidoreductase [Catenulispora pinisilvae]|uniref:NAD(P)/FAD-dependent oxidoreductase n=1 Tax=Catenulispora pinisilvae TaxID=2705253 RepID=UPI001891CFE9|nr:FAD-dependent oxidoreductase [Catenulispora pinisilvae]